VLEKEWTSNPNNQLSSMYDDSDSDEMLGDEGEDEEFLDMNDGNDMGLIDKIGSAREEEDRVRRRGKVVSHFLSYFTPFRTHYQSLNLENKKKGSSLVRLVMVSDQYEEAKKSGRVRFDSRGNLQFGDENEMIGDEKYSRRRMNNDSSSSSRNAFWGKVSSLFSPTTNPQLKRYGSKSYDGGNESKKSEEEEEGGEDENSEELNSLLRDEIVWDLLDHHKVIDGQAFTIYEAFDTIILARTVLLSTQALLFFVTDGASEDGGGNVTYHLSRNRWTNKGSSKPLPTYYRDREGKKRKKKGKEVPSLSEIVTFHPKEDVARGKWSIDGNGKFQTDSNNLYAMRGSYYDSDPTLLSLLSHLHSSMASLSVYVEQLSDMVGRRRLRSDFETLKQVVRLVRGNAVELETALIRLIATCSEKVSKYTDIGGRRKKKKKKKSKRIIERDDLEGTNIFLRSLMQAMQPIDDEEEDEPFEMRPPVPNVRSVSFSNPSDPTTTTTSLPPHPPSSTIPTTTTTTPPPGDGGGGGEGGGNEEDAMLSLALYLSMQDQSTSTSTTSPPDPEGGTTHDPTLETISTLGGLPDPVTNPLTRQESWNCQVCTFINESSSNSCTICGSERSE